MEELKDIHDICCDGNNIFFQANENTYKISQNECLSLVYALYDSLGLSYTEPNKLDEIINPN